MGFTLGVPKCEASAWASPVELEVGFHHRCLVCDHRSPGMVELVMWLHHGSPRVVKLVMRLHQGCYIREHEVSRGSEANDGAAPPKMEEGEVQDELHYGSPNEREASVGASP